MFSMSGYNSEFDSDGDWDDRGDLAWNEYDWQKYLKQNDAEVVRFFSFYRKMRHHPNRLDEIARLMGWDREDWNAGEIASSTPEGGLDNDTEFSLDDEMLDIDDLDPYTLHRHPVYVVTKGLYNYLQTTWNDVVKGGKAPELTTALAVDFTSSLHNGELQAILGVSALDMGDYSLCVTHLKYALSAVNNSFGLIQQLPLRESRECAMFHAEGLPILFDLRDLWLRVMTECREEHKRGFWNDE